MTYDHELTLIGQTYTDDDIGNQIPAETETTILCDKKSVARNEFYKAASEGFKPELIFVVHSYEYSGESIVEFEGTRYSVIRTYEKRFEELEITCKRVISNG